jgi:hypothetical protein
MLVELGLVEQRYKAVLEVLDDGASVTDMARRYGVGGQAVHTWLRRYAEGGLGGLVDKSSRPDTCPHQMPPRIEAQVLEMRRLHPGSVASGIWGVLRPLGASARGADIRWPKLRTSRGQKLGLKTGHGQQSISVSTLQGVLDPTA